MARVLAVLASFGSLAPSAAAAQAFTDVTATSGAAGSWATCGLGAADIDGDGDLDLCTSAVNGGSSRVYRNNGNGTFVDVSNSGTGGESQTCVLGDIHNDGIPDLYHGWYWSGSRFFQGSGGPVPFSDATASSGTGIGATWTGTSFADVDNDGFIDLFVARYGPNHLFMNNHNGTFTNQAGARGVAEGSNARAVAFADVDGDGDQDFFVGLSAASRLFINNGSGFFSDNAAAAGLASLTQLYNTSFGDIDNDGDLDLFTASWSGSWLFENNGAGIFTDISAAANVDGFIGAFGSAFGDYDNDGDLDLYVGGGEIGGGNYVNLLFRNDGGNVFTEVAAAEGVQDSARNHVGAIFLDVDNDGDLDIFASRGPPANENAMYRNNTNGANYLKVRAVGSASNWSGIGARIWIYDSGELGNPAFLRGFREVSAGSGQASCPPTEQHFGLPAGPTYDVRVRFPNGMTVDLLDQATAQVLTVVEPIVVINVSSTAPNGVYAPGDAIPITITFTVPVMVTGIPELTLETGPSDGVAAYVSGSGTDTLTFLYTVGAGHRSQDLDCAGTSALNLNGGSIRNGSGNDADLALPPPGTTGSLGANKNLKILAGISVGGKCGSLGIDLLLLLIPLAILRRRRRRHA